MSDYAFGQADLHLPMPELEFLRKRKSIGPNTAGDGAMVGSGEQSRQTLSSITAAPAP